MADIINLRRAKKARERQLKDEQAADNRVRFGRGKNERKLTSALQEIDRSRLDGNRLTDD